MQYDTHINNIAESWVNGQKEQAVEQFKRAISEGVDSVSLLAGLHDHLPMVNYAGITAFLIRKAYDNY